MILGIFLSPGESFTQMKQSGQDTRFIDIYIKNYAQNFQRVYVFSYINEKVNLPSNVILVTNNTNLHRFIYALLLPLIHKSEIGTCNVIRGFGLASSISALFLTKPFVFNWQYDYISLAKLEKKYFYVPFYYIAEKIAFYRAKKVLIATKSKFRKLHSSNHDKLVYLPNLVDTFLFKHKKNPGRGIVYVGRLEKQKNLYFLIDSISILPRKMRKVTFLGDGLLRDSLLKYSKRKKVDLTISKPIANSKLPAFLSKFTVFTLTSLVEGSPKSLLEAMASGLPCVLTRFQTASEVVTDGTEGFIVDYSKEKFAEKLNLLLSDKKVYQKMSANSALKAKTEFEMTNLIKKEILILKNV